jgi:hypothetical protein
VNPKELAYDVLAHIRANPHEWDQGTWLHETRCGTVACFAGWACLLAGDEAHFGDTVMTEDGVLDVDVRAADLLDLTCDDANDLFSEYNTLVDLERYVEKFYGPQEISAPTHG